MKRELLLAATLFLILASSLCAQQAAGDKELQLQGNLVLDTSEGSDSGGAGAILGWFFTDRQEVGGSLFASIHDDDIAGTAGAFYRYNFGVSKIVPFAGASAAASFGPGDGNAIVQLEGGVRFFLDRRTAFTTAAIIDYSVDESEFSDQVNVLFGFSRLWGK